MYFNSTVPIPSEKGKIITKKKGSSTYVLYQYGQVYKPDKKYAVPQRTIIGKVKPDTPDTMYPNERFQEYFPSVSFPEYYGAAEPPVRSIQSRHSDGIEPL